MPNLNDAQSALERHFGFSKFREGQADVIRAVLGGRDVIVVMPTGGGKSLCYQLPALLFEGTTLVISPLIALMKDQVDALNARDIPATFINSSLSFDEQLARLRAVQQGEYRLIYVAPERFRNERFIESLREVEISLFAVDEAHCISQWGHDFRPDYLRLRGVVESLGRPRIIALTATATPLVRTDIAAQLALENPANFIAGFDRHNLSLRVEQIKSDRDRITRVYQIAKSAKGTGIVYCATRKAVEEVAASLQKLGLMVGMYHAGFDEAKRSRVQDAFMAGDLNVIVATNAFGMGVDKPDIRFVTHYQLPGSVEAYYQEVGRAGRDGLPSICTLLFNYIDTRIHDFFIEGGHPPRDQIEEVYACLLEPGLETLQLTAGEIATRLGIRNEMAVNTSLVWLEKAGHIERGQGIRVLDRVKANQLRVDWGDLARREAAERRKLREMINYAYHEKCLRQFVLRYFGDRKQTANCRCSNCQPKLKWGEVVKAEGKTPPAVESQPVEQPQTLGPRALSDAEHLAARKILSCIARMEGRFGKNVVAGVLRGSKAKNILANQLDQLSTYGLLGEFSQDELTRFINALIVANCVKQTGGAYPTVALTTLGRAVMVDQARVELDLEAVEADTSDEEMELPINPANLSGTREITFELYLQGLSIDQMAASRNLKPTTIGEHLARMIEEGREIAIDRFVNPADRALIEAAARKCGLDALSPIKAALPERIGYGEIRLVVATLKRRR